MTIRKNKNNPPGCNAPYNTNPPLKFIINPYKTHKTMWNIADTAAAITGTQGNAPEITGSKGTTGGENMRQNAHRISIFNYQY